MAGQTPGGIDVLREAGADSRHLEALGVRGRGQVACQRGRLFDAVTFGGNTTLGGHLAARRHQSTRDLGAAGVERDGDRGHGVQPAGTGRPAPAT